MDFQLSKEEIAIGDKCRSFAQQEISPYVEALEENLEQRKALFQKMARQSLFLLGVPKSEGGAFTTTGSLNIALKEIAKVDAGIAVAMSITNMIAEAISVYGSPEQKKKYIAKVADGSCVPLAFAVTEEHAGSDVKSIQTRAEPDSSNPDIFILNGEKWFITNADMAGMVVVIAQTTQGMTAFLVDQGTAGFQVIKKERKLGLLTANLVRFRLTDCKVPRHSILGNEGDGFKIAMSNLDSGRLGIAAQAIGIAEAALEAALQHAKQRIQFNHLIAANQAIGFKLADMQVKLSAAQLLLYKAGWLKDQHLPFTREASEAKLYCSEICSQIADEALQIFGGRGYIKDYPVEKYFRDARVTTLYEGTSEIQRLIIARSLLGDLSNRRKMHGP